MSSCACSFSAAFGNGYKFTGKERDSESGLDEFGARYYASSLGRFMIPDWAAAPTAVPYAHYGNPQSLNLYSYVQNNPSTVGDPDGHQDDPGTLTVTWSEVWGAAEAGEVLGPEGGSSPRWSRTHGMGRNPRWWDRLPILLPRRVR